MRRTKSGLPKHCSWNLDRANGKRRVRFSKGGFRTYLAGTPWSEDFMHAYAAALDGVKVKRREIGAGRTRPGTIKALIASYYKLVFPTLKASTQAVRRNTLETFRNEFGDDRVADLKHQHVAAIIAAKADTPNAANNLLKVLRHMLGHAVDIDMIDSNPALKVKKFKIAGDGIHTWSEDEVAQFVARHPIGSGRPHLALMLMLWTGQRRSDIVRMGWQHVRDWQHARHCKIAVRQEKTDEPLLLPVTPELRRALASVPRTNMTFLLTARGAPFTKAGFGNWMRDRCDEAGLPQCSSHGLRKLTATRLIDAGCSDREVTAVLGHKSPSQLTRYIKERNQVTLADQAMRKLVARRTNGRRNLPAPDPCWAKQPLWRAGSASHR
jgi:integrase